MSLNNQIIASNSLNSSKLAADLLLCHQHMENAYPGSNILVVTLTNGESKRVEAQSDEETLEEAMGVLRDMFGPNIPNATDILVPRWWNNRFQRGSYSNYPIISDNQDVHYIKVIPILFLLPIFLCFHSGCTWQFQCCSCCFIEKEEK
jgi:hypothetical protein